MKLKAEAYAETILIELKEDVTEKSIAILVAGLKKYVEANIKWVFINFTEAKLTTGAAQVAQTLRRMRGPNAHPSLKKLVFVSPNREIADFLDLEKAFQGSPSRDTTLLLEVLSIQTEIARLKTIKTALEAGQFDREEERKRLLLRQREKDYLTYIRNLLTTEVKRSTTRMEKEEQVPVLKKDVDELRGREKEIIEELRKLGVMG
jgi:hypothetical protein